MKTKNILFFLIILLCFSCKRKEDVKPTPVLIAAPAYTKYHKTSGTGTAPDTLYLYSNKLMRTAFPASPILISNTTYIDVNDFNLRWQNTGGGEIMKGSIQLSCSNACMLFKCNYYFVPDTNTSIQMDSANYFKNN